MAAALVQLLGQTGNSNAGQTTTVLSISKTVTAGNKIYVGWGGPYDITVASVTDNLGNTYSRVERTRYTLSTADLWVATITTGGTLTTITASHASTQYVAICAAEFSGVGTLSVAGGGLTGAGTTITWASNKTIPANGLAVGVAFTNNDRVHAPGPASGTPSTSISEVADLFAAGELSMDYAIAGGSTVSGFSGTTTLGSSNNWAGAGGVYNPSAADIALVGAATGTSTATGALTTGIPLAGVVAGQSAASGALTTAIPLAGAVGTTSATAGTLTTSILLAGTAAGVSAVSGTLTTGIPLAGAVSAVATVTGSLTTGAALAGVVGAVSAATGTLTTSILLAGSTAGVATVTGNLTGGAPMGLASQVNAVATVSGSLTTGIPLVGTIAAVSTVSGSLTSGFAFLLQPFYLGSVYATLSQPFDLLGPPIHVELHQLFDLTGPLGATLSQPFDLLADLVGTSLHQPFDLLAAGTTSPPVGVPPLWLPMMVFDKAGTYLGSIAAFNVTNAPVRYLRSRRVTNEGGMTFNVPRSSPDIGLIASDRLVRLQSPRGETPWWGTMAPRVNALGIVEVVCSDPFTVLRDGPAIILAEEVGDNTPATGVYARIMAIHNDLRGATGEAQWELDLQGSRPFRGDIDFDADTLSCLDTTIARSRTEIAWDSRLEGNRLVPILRVRDTFAGGAGAAIYDGPGGNIVAGVQVVEDPSAMVHSIRLTGVTTDLAQCLPDWALWALKDITPEIIVSIDPGAHRMRQRLDESVDWGMSKAAVTAQCNAIVAWIWELYRSFLRAVHDIEGRPWHDGWAYIGPPDAYEPKSAGRDSLSRRAWKTRLQLVEIQPNEPASAVMLSDKHCLLDLREWLVVTYNRVTGVQTVTTVPIPSAAGLSLIAWHTLGTVVRYKVSGKRIVSRSTFAADTGAYVDPYSVRIWDPVDHRDRNLRRIISGPYALAYYIDPGDADNRLTDLGPDAAIDQAAGDGSSFIGKMYDFEEDAIDDYDPRSNGIGVLKTWATAFNGTVTNRPRWHISSFNVGGDAVTSLVEGISATDADFEVESILGFPDPDADAGEFPFLAQIDDGSNAEIVLVISMVGSLWHVARGQQGTTAIIHEAGATVKRSGAAAWDGFPFLYTWPEGEQWAAEELAELSKPRIDLDVHVAHFRGDQLTIGYGTTHAVNVATEGPSGRWIGTGRAIGWSTDAAGGETELVLEWQT